MNIYRQAIATNSVIITVVKTKGSSPCRVGDRIIYQSGKVAIGTIGGGGLEFKALKHAEYLPDTKTVDFTEFKLSTNSDQCCGGMVQIMFERGGVWLETLRQLSKKQLSFTTATITQPNSFKGESKFIYQNNHLTPEPRNLNFGNQIVNNIKKLLSSEQKITIDDYQVEKAKHQVCLEKFNCQQVVVLFGAGHICRALMPILQQLPINIFWVDDRDYEFAKFEGKTDDINIICDGFLTALKQIPEKSYCLVITYSHEHDFAICEQILRQDNFSYLGLIGSKTKGNRFRSYLREQNLRPETIAKLHCPIGKKRNLLQSPIAIAVAIVEQLLDFLEEYAATP